MSDVKFNERLVELLRSHGYDVDGLSDTGALFALIKSKAADRRAEFEKDDYPEARALISEFCRMIIKNSESAPKKIGLFSKEVEAAFVVNAFVRLFADRELLQKFEKGSK